MAPRTSLINEFGGVGDEYGGTGAMRGVGGAHEGMLSELQGAGGRRGMGGMGGRRATGDRRSMGGEVGVMGGEVGVMDTVASATVLMNDMDRHLSQPDEDTLINLPSRNMTNQGPSPSHLRN